MDVGFTGVATCMCYAVLLYDLKNVKGRKRKAQDKSEKKQRWKQMEECEHHAPSDNTLALEVVNLHTHKINERSIRRMHRHK